MYKNDPRIIKARFKSSCSETGRTIAKGEQCVYYPVYKQVFHLESKQAQEFREWKADIDYLDSQQNYY